MATKTMAGVEVKNADKGEVSAVFSRFNVVDKDGDVTVPGAFEDGAEVRISAYQHQSWTGALPVGKGTIRQTDTEAILDGQFFLNTQAGRDTFEVVKGMGPLQEWSYGFDVLDSEPGKWGGEPVNFLKRMKTHEVSPVMIGAGVDTRTLSVKTGQSVSGEHGVTTFKRAIRPHDTSVSSSNWDASAVVAGIPNDASVSNMRSVFAWVDSEGDPENKASYKFPHHNGVDGAANARACIAGIAALNGARGGSDIPAEDRQGVYEHLAAHLRDADREPPELSSGSPGSMKLNDQIVEAMVVVSEVVESAERVGALRAEKGKTLSRVNAEYLDWLRDGLKRLDFLLNSPEDDMAREYAQFVASARIGE